MVSSLKLTREKKYICLEAIYSLALSFTKAVFVLYLFEKGLTKFQVGTLFSIFNIVVIVATPFGAAFCEMRGAKQTLFVGALLKVITAIIFIYSTTYNGLLTAEIFSAIAVTFFSGTLTSWALRGGKIQKQTKLYDLFNKIMRYKYLVLLFGGLLGAYLADYSLILPWAFNGIFFAVFLFCSLTLNEPFYVKRKKENIRSLLIKGYKLSLKERGVFLLLLATFLSSFSLASVKLFWLPLVKNGFNTSFAVAGWIWVGITGANFIGTFLVKKYVQNFELKMTSLYLFSFLSTSFLVVAVFLSNHWSTIIFYFLFEVGKPLYNAVKKDILNCYSDDDGRVTLLSIRSLVIKLGRVLGISFFTIIMGVTSFDFAWNFSAVIFASTIVIYFFARKSIKQEFSLS